MTSSGLFVAYLKISSKKLHFQVQNCTCSIGIPIRAMYYRVPLSSPSIKCLHLFYTPEALCISQLQVWWITTLRICEMARLIHFLQGWNFHGLPWSCKRKLKKKTIETPRPVNFGSNSRRHSIVWRIIRQPLQGQKRQLFTSQLFGTCIVQVRLVRLCFILCFIHIYECYIYYIVDWNFDV